MKPLSIILLFALQLFSTATANGAAPKPEHVLVIGCDGMGSVAFEKASTPAMRKLMEQGAYTLKARAVMPTSSSPNWASMIMGAGPEQHGVTSNDWQPDKFDIAPQAVGTGGIFPTIFGLMREQRPDSQIIALYDWKDFGRLLETNAPNITLHVKDAIETAQKAVSLIKEKKPEFMFVHFDGVDHAGHAFGWKGPQYVKAVELTDSLVDAMLEALESAGIREKTVVLITADHGGKGTSHGGNSMDELLIPWIISGPGIAAGKQISTLVNTFDTAPTLARILRLKPHPAWIGKPVDEAFKQE